MLIITERLLSLPDAYKYGKATLLEFYRLFLSLGVDRLEMSIPVYNKLAGKADRQKICLRLNDAAQMEDWPGFAAYVSDRVFKPERGLLWEVEAVSSFDILRAAAYKGGLRILLADELILYNYAALFKKILANRREPAELCPLNNYGCAGALILEWAASGGKHAATGFLGQGGFAPLEEVLLAANLAGLSSENIQPVHFAALKKLCQENGAPDISPYKSILGDKIFHVESGIHVDGISKDEASYEPFSPASVGAVRHIQLGGHSGKKSVLLKAAEHGVSLTEAQTEVLLTKVIERSRRLERGLKEEEFLLLLRAYQEEEHSEEDY